MNCQDYEAALSASVDGPIDGATATALHDHLAVCGHCRALADDFRAIQSVARTLERHLPPARTWHRIAEAVEAGRRSSGFAWLAWRPLAAASVVLMLASATWFIVRPANQQAPAAATEAAATPTAASPAFDMQSTEAQYETAIASLEQITSAGGMELDPMTAEILKVNLTVIDMAIGESRAALETEPASDVAQQSLFAALGRKVSLLQDTVTLINEMRTP